MTDKPQTTETIIVGDEKAGSTKTISEDLAKARAELKAEAEAATQTEQDANDKEEITTQRDGGGKDQGKDAKTDPDQDDADAAPPGEEEEKPLVNPWRKTSQDTDNRIAALEAELQALKTPAPVATTDPAPFTKKKPELAEKGFENETSAMWQVRVKNWENEKKAWEAQNPAGAASPPVSRHEQRAADLVLNTVQRQSGAKRREVVQKELSYAVAVALVHMVDAEGKPADINGVVNALVDDPELLETARSAGEVGNHKLLTDTLRAAEWEMHAKTEAGRKHLRDASKKRVEKAKTKTKPLPKIESVQDKDRKTETETDDNESFEDAMKRRVKKTGNRYGVT